MLSRPILLTRCAESASFDLLKAKRVEVLGIAPNEAWRSAGDNWQLAYKAWVMDGEVLRWIDIEDVNDALESGAYVLERTPLQRVLAWVRALVVR